MRAAPLRRGDRALRHRPARHCASASSWSTSPTPCASTEFKVFRSVIDSRRRGARASTPGAREMPRSALDGLISRAQELGAKGLVWAFREGEGWRSPTAKFLSAEELARAQRAARRRGGRPAAASSPTSATVANAVLGQLRLDLRRALRPDPRGRATDLLWIVDWPLMECERGGGALGPAAPPVHRARRRLRPRRPGRRRGRSPTTSSGTARRWAAARSASATPSVQQARSSPRSASTPRRPRRASASCSRRCATAPRRTAASPTGSTGSSSASPAPTRSAT